MANTNFCQKNRKDIVNMHAKQRQGGKGTSSKHQDSLAARALGYLASATTLQHLGSRNSALMVLVSCGQV